jgi:hypothetical protein
MTGGGIKQKSDGSTAFCFGNCTMSGKGVYSSFTRYLVKKLKELVIYSRDEFNTFQMFPELGERVIEAGNDKIRIKYCPTIKVHIYIQVWQYITWQIFKCTKSIDLDQKVGK